MYPALGPSPSADPSAANRRQAPPRQAPRFCSGEASGPWQGHTRLRDCGLGRCGISTASISPLASSLLAPQSLASGTWAEVPGPVLGEARLEALPYVKMEKNNKSTEAKNTKTAFTLDNCLDLGLLQQNKLRPVRCRPESAAARGSGAQPPLSAPPRLPAEMLAASRSRATGREASQHPRPASSRQSPRPLACPERRP